LQVQLPALEGRRFLEPRVGLSLTGRDHGIRVARSTLPSKSYPITVPLSIGHKAYWENGPFSRTTWAWQIRSSMRGSRRGRSKRCSARSASATAFYEQYGPGLATFMAAAMAIYADQALETREP